MSNLYRRRMTLQSKTGHKPTKSTCFVGYDGELYRYPAGGEADNNVRWILHETLARELEKVML